MQNYQNPTPILKRGRLKNGNTPGDPTKAPRCGAKNRQAGPCQCPAMRGKRRCRLHGGKSTGAKTKAGIQRIRAAHWRNGSRSARYQAEHRAWAKKQEAKETVEILWALIDRQKGVPPLVFKLLGISPVPRVRVRYRGPGMRPGGPPEEWGKE